MKKVFLVTTWLWVGTLSGAAWADIVIDDGGVHDIDYEVADAVFVRDGADGSGSQVNVLGGAAFLSAVTFEQHSRLDMSGGEFQDDLTLAEQSHASITGGSARRLFAIDDAVVTVSGNAEIGVSAMDNAVVTIEDEAAIRDYGVAGSRFIDIRGGTICHVLIAAAGHVDISGGRFTSKLLLATTTVSISGGVFDTQLMNAADIVVSGGQFNQDIEVSCPDATLTFIGSDFAVNGLPVADSQVPNFGLVESTWVDGRDCLTGVVTGTLADGTALNQTVYVIDSFGYGEVYFIPEPASLWLLLAGGWVLRSRGRRAGPGRC